ncbi:hypothetical protein [Corynebacterium sp. A21]|uniref:hypothetical protein n=1 Tax=Corynebacterium sp. A21 TaxID=3457318 RepID=UPI003FD18C5A
MQLIIGMMREQHDGPGNLRIQRAERNILRNAACQVALHELWGDPLGTLNH